MTLHIVRHCHDYFVHNFYSSKTVGVRWWCKKRFYGVSFKSCQTPHFDPNCVPAKYRTNVDAISDFKISMSFIVLYVCPST